VYYERTLSLIIAFTDARVFCTQQLAMLITARTMVLLCRVSFCLLIIC